MKNDEYILSLDVSTSTIGCTLWKNHGDYGEIITVTHISPNVRNIDFVNKQHKLNEKANAFKTFVYKKEWDKINIKLIIIEEPLLNSTDPKTAAMLNQFAGMIYSKLREIYDYSVKIDYISVSNSRKYGLPEYYEYKNKDGRIAKTKTMFSNVPRKIEDVPITKYKKLLILGQIAKRFPKIKWNLNSNKTLCDKNYDKSDSIVVALGYMAMNNLWQINSDNDYTETLELIKRNIIYTNYVKTLKGDAKLKKANKMRYLVEDYQINKFLNIDLFF